MTPAQADEKARLQAALAQHERGERVQDDLYRVLLKTHGPGELELLS